MIQARHVFHAPTCGWDRIHAWREATNEPVFVWGRGSGAHDGAWFGSVKRAFRDWLEATHSEPPVTVYHDGMGADALGPLDPARHKVLQPHHWYPRWERNLEWQLRCTGIVLVGHPELAAHLRSRHGWIPERFVHVIPEPRLDGPEALAEAPGASRPRTGIWLHGRDWRRHGNRLRAIMDRWPGQAGELEVIADGRGRPRWARRDGVVWNLKMPFEFAIHRLHTWDAVLLIQDFALDAPWLLRALELGCFPLVPDGDGPARAAHWREDSAPQAYPWGDFAAAASLLQQWREQRPAYLQPFLAWRTDRLRPHLRGAAFREAWEARKQQVAALRPPRLRARKAAADWHSVAWYERVQRLRCGL
jgi:hypothetical protein